MQDYKIPRRFPLDMAGIVFPAVRTRDWNETYRTGFLLKEEIDPARLRQALEDLHPRFPSFFVSVRRGFFWYYLERMDNLDRVVQREKGYPCRPMHIFSPDGPAIRVLYDRRRLSVELSHVVADGGGVTVFLKALLARYMELGGLVIPPDSGLPDLSEPPRARELADDYRTFYTKNPGKLPTEAAAYQYHAPRTPGYLKVIHAMVPLEDILPLVKAQGLTVTDYLMAVYIHAFYTADPRARRGRRPIKIGIPVSLRKFYPSESLRNFSLYANMSFDPKAHSAPRAKEDFSFEDILEAMRGKLAAAIEPEKMHRLLCENMSLMQNPAMRLMPNVLKRQFMRLGYLLLGESTNTAPLSNLGRFQLPPCLAERVASVETFLGGNPRKSFGCVVISDERLLHLYFSGETRKTDVQRAFLRHLTGEGLRIRVESNIRKE